VLPEFSAPVQGERVDADELRVVWLEEAIDGFGDNPHYREIAEVSWGDVADAIITERELLAEAVTRAKSDDDFDRLADHLVVDRLRKIDEEEDDEEAFDRQQIHRLHELDLGVMSAVAALAAARALTTTSCRGHHSDRGETRPLVRFICDEQRLPLISSAAADAHCGLLLDSQGMLQLHAADVEALIRFAEQMMARREEFEAMPTEGVYESFESYDDYLDEYYANSGGEYFSRRDLAAVRQMIASDRPIEGQLSIFGDA
jgi:hypothetical protein